MNINVDEKNRIVYLSEFELGSEELKNLCRRFEGFTFKNIETYNESEYEYYEDPPQIELTFDSSILLCYQTPVTCDCQNRENCSKLIKCKNLLN